MSGARVLRFSGQNSVAISKFPVCRPFQTLEFRIKSKKQGKQKAKRGILATQDGVSSGGWRWQLLLDWDNHLVFLLYDDKFKSQPTRKLRSKTALKPEQWEHIALEWQVSAGRIRLFVNGKLDGSVAFKSLQSCPPLHLGTARYQQKPFVGELADLAVFRGRLSLVELQGRVKNQWSLYERLSTTRPSSRPVSVCSFPSNPLSKHAAAWKKHVGNSLRWAMTGEPKQEALSDYLLTRYASRLSCRAPRKGGIVRFQRPGDYLHVSRTFCFETQTWELWLRPRRKKGDSSSMGIFSAQADKTNAPWRYQMILSGSNQIQFSLYDDRFKGKKTRFLQSRTRLSNHQWIHIAVTLDVLKSRQMRLFINGKLEQSTPVHSHQSCHPLFVGLASYAQKTLRGDIAELGIYKRVLADSWIQKRARGQVSLRALRKKKSVRTLPYGKKKEMEFLSQTLRWPSGIGVPPLLTTALVLQKKVLKQESRKDATCWTTVRMMESFYARKPMTGHAYLLKIEASRLLLYRLWRKASLQNSQQALNWKSIESVLPASLKKDFRDFEQNPNIRNALYYERKKRKNYHKVTENLRYLLSITFDALLKRGVFKNRPVDLKPLDLSGIRALARASTLLTLQLLRLSNQDATQRKQNSITLHAVQRAYRKMLPSLKTKQQAVSAPRSAMVKKASILRWLQMLTLRNNLNKVRALRSWNRSVWVGRANEQKGFLELFNRLLKPLGTKLTRGGLHALQRTMLQFLRFVASGNEPIRPDNLMAQSLQFGWGTGRVGVRAQKHKRTFLTLRWIHRVLEEVTPHRLKTNGDVVFRYSRKFWKMKRRADGYRGFKPERVALVATSLDATRDVTMHWWLMAKVWNEPGRRLALDPMAAELLAERTSELIWFFLREVSRFARQKKRKVLDASLWHAFLSPYPPMFFAPPTKVHWSQKNQLRKKAVLSVYKGQMFQNLSKRIHNGKVTCFERYVRQFFNLYTHLHLSKEDQRYRVYGMDHGSGVAVGDFDGDGRPDLFFGGEGCNRLYRNLGQFRFQDVTDKAGIRDLQYDVRHALFVDVNNDGRLDLFVVHIGTGSRLWLQKSNGTFVDVTKTSGIKTPIGAMNAVFFDYDNDGLLDLYVGVYGTRFKKDKGPSVDGLNARPNQLYRNLGNGKFKDVTRKAGVGGSHWTMAAAALDINNDGRLDLMLSNDFGRDTLYLNQGNGTFREVARRFGSDDRGSGMNLSYTDFNHDGYWDVYVSLIDMFSKSIRLFLPTLHSFNGVDKQILDTAFYLSGNKFFLNHRGKRFSAREQQCFEPGARGWSWAAAFTDIDNDGDEDMYLANGWKPRALAHMQRNVLFIREGKHFYRYNRPSTLSYRSNSRSISAVDLDGDGAPDFVLNDYWSGPKLFRNQINNGHHWVKIRLHGVQNNRFGVGASVRIKVRGLPWLMRLVSVGKNYLSQEDTTLLFGVKKARFVREIRVRWPGGKTQVLTGAFPVGKTLHITEGKKKVRAQ